VNEPPVSVIIVNWNHGPLLPGCLNALLAQEYPCLDITVVDNASQDGSPAWIADHYPAVRLWALPENRGFAAALNWGVDRTQGKLILSLNPDVTVTERFVAELVQALVQDIGIGIVAPKLLQAEEPARLDSTGLFVDRRRRPYDRGQGERDLAQYDTMLEVFGACGAAALYRRSMLADLAVDGEYFDEVFFTYYEDADLAWRAQLQGWRAVYAPRAVALHARGGGDTLRKQGRAAKSSTGPRLALRNRYLMTIKNDSLVHFLADLPSILAAELPRLGYAAVTRPRILLGILDLVRAVPSAWAKRRQVQCRRTVDPASLRGWFIVPPAGPGRGE
jgi:GT2 family glycosyltransferase